MTTSIKLSDTQKQILKRAAKTTDGKLVWFPDNVKGGARKRLIDALLTRSLITADGTDWTMTAQVYNALGLPRPAPARGPITLAALDAVISNAEAAKPRTRENSKQAQVIAMLKRPEGATIPQICETTGWQQHTVRGTMAGAFKKKLGLAIESTKEAGRARVYRIST